VTNESTAQTTALRTATALTHPPLRPDRPSTPPLPTEAWCNGTIAIYARRRRPRAPLRELARPPATRETAPRPAPRARPSSGKPAATLIGWLRSTPFDAYAYREGGARARCATARDWDGVAVLREPGADGGRYAPVRLEDGDLVAGVVGVGS
jgi:hypothetical protein